MKKTILSLVFGLCMAFVLLVGYSEKSTPVKHQMELFAVSCNLP